MDWVWNNLVSGEDIVGLTLDHLALAAPPIIIGFVLSIPLGFWASRSPIARSVLLSIFSILYTLPSLVVFVVVPEALGLDILNPSNVVVALTIYAMAIMVRSSADAFAAVSTDVRESARAVGFSAWQRFWRVELPLSGPVLLAGVRVVSVSTVSLVTVAVFIGIPTLGNMFHDGQQINYPPEIWIGIGIVLLIAVVFDVVISTIGRILLPWNRRASRRRASRALLRGAVA